jgi:two-component sensor histidine kinase
MPAVAASSTAALASEGYRETALLARPPPPAGKRYRPMNDLLALSERPAGVIALTTLSEVLSRISGSIEVCFGQYLRDLCQEFATMSGGSSGPKLTCAAANAALPIGTAVTLRLIADLIITNALIYAFPPRLAGWITVRFTAAPEAWQLVVEDSGIAMSADDRRDNGLTIARLLVRRHDGQLEIPSMTGGTRCIVAIPRAART